MNAQASKIETFYNNYGYREWERLERSPYDHLNYLLHMDFIDGLIKPSSVVCDVGCGGGRFSIEFAKRAQSLSLVDISKKQLDIAVAQLKDNHLSSKLGAVYHCDLSEMDQVACDTFDVTVCYGAPLNYLYDNYVDGIKALYRITKPGGTVLASVNSRLGVLRALCANDQFDICHFLEHQEYWYVDQVIDTGDLPEHPEVEHPARHFFHANELIKQFEMVGFKDIKTASSPCLVSGLRQRVEMISKNEEAWKTLVRQELKIYTNDALADVGEFLMIKGIKPLEQ